MGFLKKLFGGGASLEALRRAMEQQRYADARLLAEQLAAQDLEPAARDEVAQLGCRAGDALARLNLEEARGQQRLGQFDQARDHLELALEQARSSELREEIEQLRNAENAEILPPDARQEPSPADLTAKTVSVQTDQAADSFPEDLDTRLDLLLTAYPQALAERYAQRSTTFKEAFVRSQAGEDQEACELWQKVLPAERDDLYYFEWGSLMARQQRPGEAAEALDRALGINPGLTAALDVLVAVLVSRDGYGAAMERLEKALNDGIDEGLVRARRATLEAQQERPEAALEEARRAFAAGHDEPAFLVLSASLHEKLGDLDEAEQLLQKLPAPRGCRGGISLPLAEFWLRQQCELPRVLEAFNTACREDPGNPRWQLRAAQTYAARGWTRDAKKLLSKVVGDPRLEPQLRREAEQSLAEQGER